MSGVVRYGGRILGRNSKTEHLIDYSNTIKKSNELSMAKLNQGLTLNQMQLLAYAIFSTQQNGKTEFRKYEFQDKFGIKDYKTDDAYEDSDKVSTLRFSTQDLENDKFSFTNVFSSIEYENGHFTFEWNKKMIPYILELKKKYVLTDLTITSNFKSGFSWILYDYLKAHYGYWHKEISKDALMNLLQ
ncbi:replication initiation protein [Lentibacillus cibarius]|uniref:Replication initiation protein n=1 Tax=Lentibacillus cibarius TaxID=2583219 RepID=A0A5S3QHG9_9BACI|nr:replication initiation protein [Lentibacillus cibarius]